MAKLKFAFFLAAEIIQVSDSIAWIHCASGNVCLLPLSMPGFWEPWEQPRLPQGWSKRWFWRGKCDVYIMRMPSPPKCKVQVSFWWSTYLFCWQHDWYGVLFAFNAGTHWRLSARLIFSDNMVGSVFLIMMLILPKQWRWQIFTMREMDTKKQKKKTENFDAGHSSKIPSWQILTYEFLITQKIIKFPRPAQLLTQRKT